jgi:tetratricopeptide (TPR) repeat protein
VPIEKPKSNVPKSLEIDPNLVVGYLGGGFAYYNLQNYSEAIADFTKGLEINPGFTVAYYYPGDAYYNLQEDRKAIADFTIYFSPIASGSPWHSYL